MQLKEDQYFESLRWCKDVKKEKFLVQPVTQNCDILVSLQHKDPQRIAQLSLPILQTLPTLLLSSIETLLVPFDNFEDITTELRHSYKPNARPAAFADYESAMIIIAGTQHDDEDYDLFSSYIITHETGHLLDEDGGVPKEFENDFMFACHMDKEYQEGIKFFPSCFDDFTPIFEHNLVTRHWLKNNISINTYGALEDKENWCESMATYVNSIQGKNFYEDYDAADFWPYRFEFFQQFFQQEFL